jgi:diguanylate cyclase (GGDEF)-like protein/PAS domain S-box-containing protein
VYDVVSALLFQHELALVVLAAVICAVSAFAGVSLLHRARRARGTQRHGWAAVGAVTVGFGVWATHFIAMLAFRQDLPAGYDLGLTALSLVTAILIIGGGLLFAAIAREPADMALGGCIVGIGIAGMHYAGMASLVIGGQIVWDWSLISASIVLGIVFGGLALFTVGRVHGLRGRLRATALLTIAICAMHFTGMGAANLDNCFSIVESGDVTPTLLSIGVALVSAVIIAAALGALWLDAREERRSAVEADRMMALAEAAIEGLVVADAGRIAVANGAFAALAGQDAEHLAGVALDTLLQPGTLGELVANAGTAYETAIRRDDGTQLPVEVIARRIVYAGRPATAFAVRDLSARKRDEQQLRFLAHHDSLTGLANRAAFNRQLHKEIAQAQRTGDGLAVLCLDLDRFKEVNDLFGHGAGDAMLRRVAECLTEVLDEGQTCARLGGDEFAVIVPEVNEPGRAGRIAESILDAFHEANLASQSGAFVSVSIGVALYPSDAATAEQLVTNADTALYRAKQDGRGVHRFFEPEMGLAVREKRLIENDLRTALLRDELAVVYQPQVDLHTGEVAGFEALMRWNHPARGAVSPAVFIPIAEESGLILAIGEWVLRTACREAAGWKNPLTVAVNVSAVQLHAADFPEQVADILMETGLAANRLEIEVTETALIRDMVRAVAALDAIKALGVRVAMDDFGTGYSSLANLRAFAFDKIKVDKSFIASVDASEQSATIVRAVLGLGSGLNVPVVAEGVERPEELEFLRRETCAEAQGYLLSRPLDISAFAALTSGETRKLDTVDLEPVTVIRLVG